MSRGWASRNFIIALFLCVLSTWLTWVSLHKKSSVPRPQTGTGPWPGRKQAAQQEVSGRWASKASSVFTATPHRSHYRLSSASCQIVAALDSHRSANPTVNRTCEGAMLCAPYENLMPDDLRWSWGGDARAGKRLQIKIIISREVWLHKDHNKSITCRLISKPYQWVATENKLRAPTDSSLWWVV